MIPGNNRRPASARRQQKRKTWLGNAIGKMGDLARFLAEGALQKNQPPLVVEQFEAREMPALAITGFSDDTGTIGDNVTADPTIKLEGTALANTKVQIQDGASLIGSTTADAQGKWSFTTTTLSDGVHELLASTAFSTSEFLTNTPYALSPDGTNPFIISQNLGQNWTFEAEYMMNSDNDNGLNTIFSYGNYTDGVLVRTLRGDSLFLKGTDKGYLDLFGGPSTNGVFVPVRITYQNDGSQGTLEIYVNGQMKDSITANGDLNPSDMSIRIGSAHHAHNEGFDGQIRNVRITTESGSGASATLALMIDTVAPSKPQIDSFSDNTGPQGSNSTSDNTIKLVGKAEANSNVAISDAGQLLGLTVADASGAWEYTTSPLPDGKHVFSVSASDQAGNISSASQALTLNVDATPPMPVFSNINTPRTNSVDSISVDLGESVTGLALNDFTLTRNGQPIALAQAVVGGITGQYYSNQTLSGQPVLTRIDSAINFNYGGGSPNQAVPSDHFSIRWEGAILPQFTEKYTFRTHTDDGVRLWVNGQLLVDRWNDMGPTSYTGSINLIAGQLTSIKMEYYENGGGAVAYLFWSSPSQSEEIVPATRLYDKLGQSFSGSGSSYAIGALGGSTALEGGYILSIAAGAAKDSVANPSKAAFVSWTVDLTPPAAPVISGFANDTGTIGDGLTSDTTLLLSGTAEPFAKVTVFDSGNLLGFATAQVNGYWEFLTASLSDNTHTFTANAADTAGNSSGLSAACVVLIDSKAPDAPVITGLTDDTGIVGDGFTSDNTITLAGTAEAKSVVAIYDGNNQIGTTTTLINGTWSFTSTILPDGKHDFKAIAIDAAGNASSYSISKILNINTNPTFWSVSTTTFAESVAGTFPVLATSNPAPIYSVAGALPTGLTLNSNTGVISGTPSPGTAGKVYQFDIVASNGVGPDAVQTFSLAVVGDLSPAERIGQYSGFVTGTGHRYANQYAFAVIRADGTVAAWGNSAYGASVPAGLVNVAEIYSTKGAFAALKRDGTVVAWGHASFGGTGMPTGLSNVRTIYSSGSAFAALKYDGTVVAWGDPDRGGTVPAGLAGVVDIYSNTESFAALKNNGTVTTWGRNFSQTINPPANLTGVVRIFSTNEAYCALKSDGTAVVWGGYGGQAPLGLSNIVAVVSNYGAFAALKADGSVISWGGGSFGGTGAPTSTGFTNIFSSGSAFAALKADGSIVTWGDPSSGGTGAPTGNGFKHIYSTSSAFAALKYDGSIVAWGAEGSGATGAPTDSGYTQIYSTWAAFAALKSDGSITSWGNQFNGGTGAPTSKDFTQIISTPSAFVALQSTGVIAAWGNTSTGGLAPAGLSSVVVLSSPYAHAPAFTVIDRAVFNSQSGKSFQVIARGVPETIALSLVGNLPSGITFNPATGAFSGTPNAGSDGTYNITITASNSLSATTIDYPIIVDVIPPDVPLIDKFGNDSGILGDGVTSGTTLFITGTAEPESLISISDGQLFLGTAKTSVDGFWSFNTPILNEGLHSINATATDAVGNISSPSSTLFVTVDYKAPDAPVVLGYSRDSGIQGDSITNDTNIKISGVAEPFSLVSLYDNGVLVGSIPADSNGSWLFYTNGLEEQNHRFGIMATDAAGNTSQETRLSILVDASAPNQPTIDGYGIDTGFIGDFLTSDRNLELSGKAEPGASISIYDKHVLIGCAQVDAAGIWKYPTKDLKDGEHLFVAKATDAAGNESGFSGEFLIAIDSIAPQKPVPFVSDFTLNAEALWIEGSADAGSLVRIVRQGILVGSLQLSPDQTNYSIPIELLQNQINELDVTAADAAGNESSPARILAVETDSLPTIFSVVSTSDANTGVANRGTLRWAINQANATAGPDIIRFNIPGSGVRTISPAVPLPALTGDITIDGFSQPGAKANTALLNQPMNSVWAVHIHSPGVSALVARGTNNIIIGLSIQAGSIGIPALKIEGDSSKVMGSRIGLDAANHATGWQSLYGIELAGNNNLVGGSQPADRNFLSNNIYGVGGTGSFNRVSGNLIGTAGRFYEPNAFAGVLFADGAKGNVIGTDSDGTFDDQEGNVISGNNYAGIYLEFASGTVIRGNFIGTNPLGNATIGNANAGIIIADAPETVVGGTGLGQGNIVSGNGQSGIMVQGSGSKNITISGNIVGLLLDGKTKAGNGAAGIHIGNYAVSSLHWDYSRHPWVGGPSCVNIVNNTISANTTGVFIGSDQPYGSRPSKINIVDNRIGSSVDGSASVPNTSQGVLIDSASDNLVENNRLIAGSAGAISITGNLAAGNVIRGNKIEVTGGAGIAVKMSPYTSILGNAIASPGSAGIIVTNANNAIVGSSDSGNVVIAASTAIVIAGQNFSNLKVSGNVIINANTGIDASNGSSVSISLNSLSSISGTGIIVTGVGNGSSIDDNSLAGISGNGIVINSSSGIAVSDNKITTTGIVGISISDSFGVELTAAPGNYAIDILSSGLVGATTIASSGELRLAAGSGKTISLAGPTNITSPSMILLSGVITTADTNMFMGDSDTPIILVDDASVATGSGNITFGGSIDGRYTLSVYCKASSVFLGTIGGNIPLSGLKTDSFGETSLNIAFVDGTVLLQDKAFLYESIGIKSGDFKAYQDVAILSNLSIQALDGGIEMVGPVTSNYAISIEALHAVILANSNNDFNDHLYVRADDIVVSDSGNLEIDIQADDSVLIVTGGSLSLEGGAWNLNASSAALNFGSTSLAGNTSIKANGPVTQSGVLYVGGDDTTINAFDYPITLNLENDFSGPVTLIGSDIVIRDRDSLALNVFANSLLVQSGNDLSLQGKVIGNLSTGAGTTIFGQTDVAGNLSVKANGPVVQNGILNVVGSTTIDAFNHSISLSQANDFNGAVTLNGTDISISDHNSLTLMLSANNGFIQASDDLSLQGMVVGNLSTNAGATIFGPTDVAGDLSVKANGAVIQNGILNVVGSTTIDAFNQSIALISQGNDFGGAVTLNGADISISDRNSLTLMLSANNGFIQANDDLSLQGKVVGNLSTNAGATIFGPTDVAGNLSVNANGPVMQNGILNVAGSTTIDAFNQSITLSQANDFSGPVTLNGTDISISDRNSLTVMLSANNGFIQAGNDLYLQGNVIGNLSTLAGATIFGQTNVAGDLTVKANGPVMQNGILNIVGSTTIDAFNQSITLSQANDFSGAVTLNGTDISISDRNSLTVMLSANNGFIQAGNDLYLQGNVIGNLSTLAGATTFGQTNVAGDLTVKANGAVLQNGILNVAGSTTIDAFNQSITLSQANNFSGAVTLNGTDISISDRNSLTVMLSANNGFIQAGNDLYLQGNVIGNLSTLAGATIFGQTNVAGDLTVKANGAVMQNGILNIVGSTTIDAFNQPIFLNQENDFVGAVALDGAKITITDRNSLQLNLTVSSAEVNSGDDLTLNGSIIENLYTSAGYTSFGQTKIDGNLISKSIGAVVQSGSLSVMGSTTINTNGQAITLNDAINHFNGIVSLTGSAIEIVDSGNLSLNLTAGSAFVTAGNDLHLKGTLKSFAEIFSNGSAILGTLSVDGPLSITAKRSIQNDGMLQVNGHASLSAGIDSEIVIDGPNAFSTLALQYAGIVKVSGATLSGIAVDKVKDVELAFNTISASRVDGIRVSSVISAYVHGNLVDSSTGTGIFIDTVSGVRVVGNTVSGSGGNGISLIGSPYSITLGNVISQNGLNGILVTKSSGSFVKENVVSASGKYGILISETQDAEIIGNTISASILDAIRLPGTVLPNIISGNNFRFLAENRQFADIGIDGYDGYSLTNLANPPVISSVVPNGNWLLVSGTYLGRPNSVTQIELYRTAGDGSARRVATYNGTTDDLGVLVFDLNVDSSNLGTGFRALASSPSQSSEMSPEMLDGQFLDVSVFDGAGQNVMTNEPYGSAVRFVVRDPSGAPVSFVPLRLNVPSLSDAVTARFADGRWDIYVVADRAGVATSPSFEAGPIAGDYFMRALVGASGPTTISAFLEIRPPAPLVSNAAVPGANAASAQSIHGTAHAGSLVRIYRADSGQVVAFQQLESNQTDFSIPLPSASENDRKERWVVTSTYDGNLGSNSNQINGNESSAGYIAINPMGELYLNSPVVPLSGVGEAGGIITITRNGSIVATREFPRLESANYFINGTDGWSVTGGGIPVHVRPDHVENGYLTIIRQAQEAPSYFISPPTHGGSRGGYYGGVMSFSLRANDTNTNIESIDVVMTGANLTLVCIAGSTPGMSWTHYRVDLIANGTWHVGSASGPLATESEIRAVLEAFESVAIRGSGEQGANALQLDEVVFNGPSTYSFEIGLDLIRNSKNNFVVTLTDRYGNPSANTILPLITEDSIAPRSPSISALVGDTNISGDQVLSSKHIVLIAKADTNIHPLQISSMNTFIKIFRDGVQIGTATGGVDGAWTFADPEALSEGSYIYTATATDRAGNESVRSLSFKTVVDTIAPDAPSNFVITPDTGPFLDSVTNNSSPRLSGLAEPGSSIDVMIGTEIVGRATADNRGRWNIDLAPLADGDHLLLIRSTDLAGNESLSARHRLVIDTVAPSAANITKILEDSGDDSADGITNIKRLTLVGTGVPETFVSIIRNGAKFGKTQVGADGIWKLDSTNIELLDGRSVFTAVASDLAGNSALASSDFQVMIDTRAPLAPRASGISPDTGNPRDRITAVANPSAIGMAEANSKVTVYLDGSAIGSVIASALGVWKYDLPEMAIGSHSVVAVATDRAGNVSPASQIMTIFIDSGYPGRPILSGISNDTGIDSTDLITRASSFSLIGTVSEPNLTVRVYKNGVLAGVTKSTDNGSFAFAVSGLVEAEYQFSAESINAAGTSSGESIPLFVCIDLTAPGTPLGIGISDDLGFIATDMLTSDNSISVGGIAEPGSLVEVLLAGQARRAYADDETGSFSVSYEDMALSDGAYPIQVLAYDASGNRSSRAATATVRIDTSAPNLQVTRLETDTGVSATDYITSDTTPTLIGSAETGSIIVARLFDIEIARTTSDSRGAWNLPLGMLQSDFYNLVIVAIDAAGNESRVPVSLVVDANAPDNASNLSITPDTGVLGDFVTSSTSVVLSGSAEISSSVSLKVNGLFTARIPVDIDGKWSAIMPLIKDGSYSVAISVIDIAGNSNQPGTFTITRDSQAPSRPIISDIVDKTGTTIQDAITSSKYVTLSGSAEPDSLLNVFSDTKLAGSVLVDRNGSWTFALPALGGKSINRFTLASIDSAGNISPDTNFVVVFDATPPSAPIIFGILDGSDIDADALTSSRTPTVRGQSEPNSRVQLVVDGLNSQTVHADSKGIWSASIFGLNDGLHKLVASAIDQAGNQGLASWPYQFTLDTSAPSAPGIDNIQPDGGSSGTDGIIGADSIVVSGHAEPFSTVRVKLGSFGSSEIIVPNSGKWSVHFDQIPDGTYVLDANTIDAAGNLASAGFRTIVIDTLAPVSPSGIRINVDSGISNTDGITNQQPQILSGRGEPGSLVEISAPALGSAISTMVLQDGFWSAKLALLAVTSPDQKFPQGITSLLLKQTDQAGNTSTTTEFIMLVDNTAPDAPDIQLAISTSGQSVGSAGSLSSSRPKIQGQAEPESSVHLEIHSTTAVVSAGIVIADSEGKWIYSPSKDLPDGAYTILAQSTDVAGNESIPSLEFGLQLDTRAPLAPAISGIGPDSGSSATDNLTREVSRIFGLAEAGSNVRFFEIMRNGSRTLLGESIAGNDRKVTLELIGSGMTLGHGRHDLIATAVDSAGNVGLDSSVRTIEVDSIAPETPTISSISDDTGLAGDGVTSDTTQIVAGIAEPGATVSVRMGGPGAPVKTALAGEDGSWVIALSLSEGIQTLEITTTDRAGNSSAIPAVRVLVIDKTAPSAPSNLMLVSDTGRLSSDGVTSNNLPELSGKAEPGSVVRVRYGLAADGANQVFGSVIAGANGFWSIGSAASFDDGKYLFEIESLDLAGNLSAKAKLSITVDTVAPAAAIAFPLDGGYYNLKSWTGSIKGSAQSLGGSSLARVIATVTDDLGQYFNGTSFVNSFTELTATGTSAWSLPIPAGSLTSGRSYAANFVVEDLAGNRDASSSVRFNFDNIAPVYSINVSPAESNLLPQTLVIDFGEPVRSFPLERLAVSDGLSVRLIDQTSGKFTLSLSPSREGVFSVKMPAGAVLDLSGNPAPAISFVTAFDISTTSNDSQKLEFSGSTSAYSGQFGKASDQDWFRIVAPYSGGLTLNLASSKSLGTSLRILDSSKNDIALADNTGSAMSSIKINVIAGQELYIGATARGVSTGAYSLALVLGDPFVDDFGNSIADPGGLPASGNGIYSVRGEINKPGDADYFKFVASATGMITFRASATGSAALIPSLSGGLSEAVFTTQTEAESRVLNQAVVRFPVTSGLTYFVKVGSHLSSGVESVGTYLLESTFASGGLEATDDQSGIARRIDLSGSVRVANYTMRLEANGDADGFDVVLPESGSRLLLSIDAGFECRVVVGIGSFQKSFITQQGHLLLDGVYSDSKSVSVRIFAIGSTGEYRLSVATDELSGDMENAQISNPGPVGEIYKGGIQLPGDVDNLAVEIHQTGKIIARLNPLGEVFDVVVEIVNQTGSVIATSTVNPDYTVQVAASVTDGQSVYVRVRGIDGATGQYSLFVQQVPDDYSDVISQAFMLSGDTSGRLDYQSDKDVFEFVASANGPYVFLARPDFGSKAEPSLRVIRNGIAVVSVDSNGPIGNGLVTVDLLMGDHVYVEVAGLGRLGRYVLEARSDTVKADDDFPDTINLAQNSLNNVIVPGQNITGAINPESDGDYLRFTLAETGRYTIKTGATAGSKLDSRLSVFQKDTMSQTWQLLAIDDDGGDGVNSQIFQAFDAGDYLLRIGSSRGTTGAYIASLDKFVTQSQVGPDDASDNPAKASIKSFVATPQGAISTVNGVIERGTDLDYYQFKSPGEGTLIINLVRTGGSLDPVVGLYDSNSSVETTNDNSGPGTTDSRLVIDVVKDQVVVISAGSYGLTTGTYRLTVSLEIPVTDDFGQSPLSSGAIPVDGMAQLEYAGDRDVFKLNPSFDGILTVHLDNVSGVSNPRIRILDSHSGILAQDVAGGIGLNSLLSIRVTIGVPVFIEATSVVGEIGSYKISTQLVEDDYANDASGAFQVNVSANGFILGGKINIVNSSLQDSGDDADWFAFKADRSGLINLRLDSLDGLNPYLFVYNSSLDLLGSQDNRSVSDTGATVPLDVIEGHTYYVRVVGTAGSTGIYTLESRPVVDDFGNSFATSTSIAVNEFTNGSITGSIDTAFDQDYFRFTPSINSRVSVILVAATNSILDSNLSAFDDAGRLIVANDDATRLTKDSLVEFSVQAGQTYYLRAQGFGSSDGSYQVVISPVAEINDEFGDTADMAESWALASDGSGHREGALQSSRDIDLLKVVSPLSGVMNLNVTIQAGNSTVRLLARNGNDVVQVASANGTGSLKLSSSVVEAREYFIRIDSTDGNLSLYSLDASVKQDAGSDLRPVATDVLSKISDEFNSAFVRRIATMTAGGDINKIQNEILSDLVRSYLLINGTPLTNVLIIYLDPVDFAISDDAGRQVGNTTNGGAVSENPSAAVSSRGALDLVIVPVSSAGSFNMNLMGVGGGRVLAGATMITPSGTVITPRVGFSGGTYSSLPAGDVPKEGLQLVLDFTQGGSSGDNGGGSTGGGGTGTVTGGTSVTSAIASAVNSTLIQTLSSQVASAIDIKGLGDLASAQATAFVNLLLTASTVDGSRDTKDLLGTDNGFMAFLANPIVQANLRAVLVVSQDVSNSFNRGVRFISSKMLVVDKLVASASAPFQQITGTVLPGKVRALLGQAISVTGNRFVQQIDISAAAMAKVVMDQAAKLLVKPVSGTGKVPTTPAPVPPGTRSALPPLDAADRAVAEFAGDHPDLLVPTNNVVNDSVWGDTDWISGPQPEHNNSAGALTAGLLVAGFLTPSWLRDHLSRNARERRFVTRFKSESDD